MDVVNGLVVVLHLVGMAGVVGGWLAHVRRPQVVPVMLHGALTALVTGILLVGLAYARGEGDDVDNVKITFKLAVALAVTVLLWVNRRREDVPGPLVHLIGGLGVLNVTVAVLWT
ncbi:MAG: hypothetical protein ACFCVF_05320 [Kineosporiaceae bacterium]